LAEHRSPKPGVAGSIPVSPATAVSTAAIVKIIPTGHRVGFQGVTFDGHTLPLAHVRIKGSLRIAPYGIDLSGLESADG
jgi:hypothetical protein